MTMKSFIETLAVLGFICGAVCTASKSLDFYSLTAKDIQGNEISLEQYKGKVRKRFHRATKFRLFMKYTELNG